MCYVRKIPDPNFPSNLIYGLRQVYFLSLGPLFKNLYKEGIALD